MNLKIGQNIIPSINFIMSSIPENTTDLEKVRYIYINLENYLVTTIELLLMKV